METMKIKFPALAFMDTSHKQTENEETTEVFFQEKQHLTPCSLLTVFKHNNINFPNTTILTFPKTVGY